MARRPDSKSLSIQLTPIQYTAVQVEATRRGIDISRFIRQLLTDAVPGFDEAIPPRGTYDRRRHFVGLCIGDEDVVTVDSDKCHAEAWKDSWHYDDDMNEVPVVYNLVVSTQPKRQFATLTELLAAMADVAPFENWRVEGEE